MDAGLVYRTDVAAAGDGVEGIDLPDAQQVVAVYPIAALGAGDARPAAARAFVAFVLGAEWRAVLTERGFLLP